VDQDGSVEQNGFVEHDSGVERDAVAAVVRQRGGSSQDGAAGAAAVDPKAEVAQRIADLRVALDQGLADEKGVGHSLGIHLASLEVDRSIWTLQPSPAAANAMFIVHGGVIATLMDTAMGSAIFTMLPADTLYTTLELKVNFIRPVALDAEKLTCDARTVHVGRRTATAECTVTSATGKLVAHGTCTCLLTSA
jgi:uncharacterized protein (TIGR00369 family)